MYKALFCLQLRTSVFLFVGLHIVAMLLVPFYQYFVVFRMEMPGLMTLLGCERFFYLPTAYSCVKMIQDGEKTQLRRQLFLNSVYYLIVANTIRLIITIAVIAITVAQAVKRTSPDNPKEEVVKHHVAWTRYETVVVLQLFVFAAEVLAQTYSVKLIKNYYNRVASVVADTQVDRQANVVITQQGLVTDNLTPSEMRASIPQAIPLQNRQDSSVKPILRKKELLSEGLQSFHVKQVSFADQDDLSVTQNDFILNITLFEAPTSSTDLSTTHKTNHQNPGSKTLLSRRDSLIQAELMKYELKPFKNEYENYKPSC